MAGGAHVLFVATSQQIRQGTEGKGLKRAKKQSAPEENNKRYFLAKIWTAGRGRSDVFPHKIKKNLPFRYAKHNFGRDGYRNEMHFGGLIR